MTLLACRKALQFAGFAVALITFGSPSSAEEATYCVTCTGPDQTYLCRVDAGGAKPSDALKLYCVIRTAKEGHHASCSAVHGSACNGIEKVYHYDGPLPDDLLSDQRIKKLQNKIKEDKKAFEKPKSSDTLVGITGRAVRNARDRFGGSSKPADQPQPLPKTEAAVPHASQNAQAAPPNTTEASEHTSSGVSGFARKSYRCMMSLFRNCSGDPESADGSQ
jgi:hypothetical protein